MEIKQSFIISPLPMNLNKYRNAHFQVINKHKILFEAITQQAVINNNIKPMKWANITFTFWFKDKRRHDPDNYALCAKFIFDGIVKAGILEDDNFDYVREFKVRQGGINNEPYILVEMESE